jgi:hypothetical protein
MEQRSLLDGYRIEARSHSSGDPQIDAALRRLDAGLAEKGN